MSDQSGSWTSTGLWPATPNFDMQAGYLYGDFWRSTWIDDQAEARLKLYDDDLHLWTGLTNCSDFAAGEWEVATGEYLSTKSWSTLGVPTVGNLTNSIIAANGGNDIGYLSPGDSSSASGASPGVDESAGDFGVGEGDFSDLSFAVTITPGDIAPAGMMGLPSPLESAVTKVIQP